MVARSLTARVLIIVVVAGAVATVAWHTRVAPDTYPYADTATTSIYVLRAAKADLATGAYSRFGWNHPGPMLYHLLAPGYALSGHREVSLKWTMLLLNVTVLWTWLSYLRQRAPWLCATAVVAVTPLIVSEQRLLFWAWNPVAPLLSLTLALTLAAGVTTGHLAALPWLCVMTSFLVQSHVGLAPVSLLLAGAGILAVMRDTWAPLHRSSWVAVRRSVAASALIAGVLWAAPVIQNLKTHPGNLTLLAQFFGENQPARPWQEVGDVFANELLAGFNPARELITGDVPRSASGPVRLWAGLQLILVMASAVWFRQHGQTVAAAFALVCVLASGIGFLSIRAIAGNIHDHQILWVGVIGVLNAAVVLSALAQEAATRARLRLTRLKKAGHILVAAYMSVVAILGAFRIDSKQRADSTDRTLRQLSGEVAAYCDQRQYVRPVLTFDWKVWSPAAGLVLQFSKHNRAIAVAEEAEFIFGDSFARTGNEPAELYVMAAEDSAMPRGVTRYTWIATAGGVRVVEVFRD